MMLQLQPIFAYLLPLGVIAFQLDPTFFGEEDIIELCISLRQEQPEGVLWASDTETVIAFLSSPSMMAASQHFAVAMTWHDKPVLLCIWPP